MDQAKIVDTNARFLNVDMTAMYEKAGEKIAADLVETYGKDSHYVFVAGKGGNAADGFSIAIKLHSLGCGNISVFVLARKNQFDNPNADIFFDRLINLKEVIKLKQNCYAEDIQAGDVLLECLIGTGLKGSYLNKRYKDAVKRFSHFDTQIIAIDVAAPHYNPDLVYSLNYPKSTNSIVIKLNIPDKILLSPGPGEVKLLRKPMMHSHKSKNGSIVVLGSSEDQDRLKPLLANVARSYATNVFSYFFDFNNENLSEIENELDRCDSILIYNLPNNLLCRSIVNEVLKNYPDKNVVLYYEDEEMIHDSEFINFEKLILIKGAKSSLNITNDKNTPKIRIDLGLTTKISNSSGDLKIIKHPQIFGEEYPSDIVILVACLSTRNDLWLASLGGNFLVKLASAISKQYSDKKIYDCIKDAWEECTRF